VVAVCRYLCISRQAYYQGVERERQRVLREQRILDLVHHQRLSHPRIGSRKLHYLLAQENLSIGRDALFALLRNHRMLVSPKRAYHKTTQSHHRFNRHPNLLKTTDNEITSIKSAKRPESLWVADITYIPVMSGEAYLSLVTDAYSRKIVGYHVHGDLKTASVSQAFKKALRTRKHNDVLIHHSDRGVQYCSALYQDIHKQHGVRCSMTDGYDCYQNALAERINGILKQEYLPVKLKDLAQAKQVIKESIRLYNEKRPHTALQYKTPHEVHEAFT